MENNHLIDTLKLIDDLQKNANSDDLKSDGIEPVFGTGNNLSYNTRPVSFYMCNNKPLTISYTDGESNIFRIEKINGSCVTIRILENNNNIFSSTDEFATININCISAIKCMNDIYLEL